MNSTALLLLVLSLSIPVSMDSTHAREKPSYETALEYTHITIMHHGEAINDRHHILTSSPSPSFDLTAKGTEDVSTKAERLLKKGSYDYIITSPLLRARQTAEIIAG